MGFVNPIPEVLYCQQKGFYFLMFLRMKVAMLLSGGVDSSVALRLLKDQGHDVTAFYLKIWLEDELAYLGDCPWEEDLKYAEEVCRQADVPLEIVAMQKEYWDRVVSYTVAEARAGRTPNPDVLCNQQIKFGQFYEKIDSSYEKVATGHYAQVTELRITNYPFDSQTCSGQAELRIKDSSTSQASSGMTGGYILKMAPDPVKDQTYFLAQLSQEQLSRAIFPIGHLQKSEVRALAEKYQLPNRNRKDSQGICFLGKIPFREFLKHHLGEKPGDFVEWGTGKIVGRHSGFWFYTIGQRQGLGLSGGPWFVVKKDCENNIVYLANGYEPDEVYRNTFEVGEIHYINDELRIAPNSLFVKIRHGAAMHPCRVEAKGGGGVRVVLDEPVHGVAAGQFAVLYVPEAAFGLLGGGMICLGGGMICLGGGVIE